LPYEHLFDTVDGMVDLQLLASELERERRSLAMLSARAPLSREKAITLLDRCLTAIEETRRGRRIG
jgi:hypothetical protein